LVQVELIFFELIIVDFEVVGVIEIGVVDFIVGTDVDIDVDAVVEEIDPVVVV